MKVILLQDVKKVGQKGSIVEAADGYAQNVLIPKKLAIVATPEAIKRAHEEQKGAEAREAVTASLAAKALAEIDGKTVTIAAKANEKGSLFKAVRAADIAQAIKESLHVALPESAIGIEGPIKEKGEHKILLTHLGAKATITLRLS